MRHPDALPSKKAIISNAVIVKNEHTTVKMELKKSKDEFVKEDERVKLEELSTKKTETRSIKL